MKEVFKGTNGTQQVLRTLRLGRGLTQSALGTLIGIDHSYVAHVESGRMTASSTLIEQWVGACWRGVEFLPVESLVADVLALASESETISEGKDGNDQDIEEVLRTVTTAALADPTPQNCWLAVHAMARVFFRHPSGNSPLITSFAGPLSLPGFGRADKVRNMSADLTGIGAAVMWLLVRGSVRMEGSRPMLERLLTFSSVHTGAGHRTNWADTNYRWKKQWSTVCEEISERLPQAEGSDEDIHLQSIMALWSHITPRDRRLIAELAERLASAKE